MLNFLKENRRWLSAGALLALLSSFGQTYFISIFAGHIREDFGLTHGNWGTIYSIGTTCSAAAMIWAGSLTDHFRARSLGSVILACLAVACIAMSLATHWIVLIGIVFLLRLTGQGMLSHIAVVAMSRWFVATRGRALAIATLGFSVGEALLPMIFVALMVIFDWRLMWVGAAIAALIGIPILRGLLQSERTPQSLANNNQSLGMKGRHWTRRQVLYHPLYWFMIPALLGPSAFNTAFFFHQVHFAEIKALSHFQLVAMFPLFTAVSILFMILSGWALDRFGTPRLLPWYQVPMIFGFIAFALVPGSFGLILGFIGLGMTSGANATLPNAFWAEFFGTRFLGTIKALATAVMVLGSAIGPGVTGVLIDLGVDLDVQYIWVAGFFGFTTLMMVIGIRRYAKDLPPRAISSPA